MNAQQAGASDQHEHHAVENMLVAQAEEEGSVTELELVGEAGDAQAEGDDDHAEILTELEDLFSESSIIAGPDIVNCTLSGGTETTCFSITVSASVDPVNHDAGPFCPETITDGPEDAGIWLEGGEVFDADGAFIENLATFYDDPAWQLYDSITGDIAVTDTEEACRAAARPDVDEAYQNYCVQCSTSYLEEDDAIVYMIPLEPVDSAETNAIGHGGVGVSFNGVRMDGPAPVEAILSAYTIAAFDDCGGHVNPFAGYHYHGIHGCEPSIEIEKYHASMIGIALDGYPIHERFDPDGTEPDDLDECRGHDVDGIGYHYHVSDPGANQIIGCFKAEYGCSETTADSEESAEEMVCDASVEAIVGEDEEAE